jgi:hypothetical protein
MNLFRFLRLSERPSGSFTSGGFLREASPLAASVLLPEGCASPEGRGLDEKSCFLREPLALSEGSELVSLPSGSFTSGGKRVTYVFQRNVRL